VKLGELLREGQIVTGLKARDKWEAIGTLVDALVAQGRVAPERRQAVLDALAARERIASTGMEHGVALPHASVDGAEEALAALGISPAGIPFLSADGQAARLIILLVIPRAGVQKHIRTLAGIARLLSYDGFREKLLRARTPREALQTIRDEERQED
jgi:mannitol/fructose-specific phosphotransferase system IIA component (Ntr-type)